MQTCQMCWEDEENNREVHFRVDYRDNDGAIELQAVTPLHVTFLCSKTKEAVRTLRVYTDKGRQLLARQLHAAGRIDAALENLGGLVEA